LTDIPPEQIGTEFVKCADPDVPPVSRVALRRARYERGKPFFHHIGGFIGKSQSGNLRRINSLVEQSGNAVGHDASFSATWTCKNEERSFHELHRLLLRLVESFKKMFWDFGFHG
jgi:hypothetical protein